MKRASKTHSTVQDTITMSRNCKSPRPRVASSVGTEYCGCSLRGPLALLPTGRRIVWLISTRPPLHILVTSHSLACLSMSGDWLGTSSLPIWIAVVALPLLVLLFWCCCVGCRQATRFNEGIQEEQGDQLNVSDQEFESIDYERLAQLEAASQNHNATGASDGELRRLPVVAVTRHMLAASSEPNCTICLATFEVSEAVRMLPCFHLFHPDCIDTWLREKSQCPMCKCAIVYTDEETELALAA